MELVNLDGQIVDPKDAKVSVMDRSFLFGDSVYETLRTYGGKLFAYSQHAERLAASAKALRLNLPLTLDELRARCEETIAVAGNEESYCRIVISRGEGVFGLAAGLDAPGRVVIIVRAFEPVPAELYERGVAMIVARTRRNPPQALDPAIKSGNYLNNIFAAIEAREAGAFDAILCNVDGNVAEGTTSTVFCVRGGVVDTPPLSAGILAGVTRRVALDAAADAGIEAREVDFTPDEMRAADEVFITSTMKEVLAVTTLDGATVGEGKPGPVTLRLAELVHERALSMMQAVE